MRIPRIFQGSPFEIGKAVELDERARKHLLQVLRLESGRELILFNGAGGEYTARLERTSKKSAVAEVLSFNDVSRENKTYIHLAQCVSKGDRFEFALQKAVELGVNEITPVFSARSQLKINHERKEKKQRHWQQIITSACEQSGRTQLPTLNDGIAVNEFLAQALEENALKLVLDPNADRAFSSITNHSSYILLIGPEGGFEEDEVRSAEKSNFDSVKLGKQILRTETAPIAAISALHFLNQEF